MCTTRGAVRRRARNALAALAFALPVIYFIDTGPAGPQSSISTRVEIFSPGRTGTRVEILSHGRADTLAAGSYGQAVNNSAPGSVAQPGWCGVVEVDDRRCPPETSVIDSPLSIATLPSGAPRWLSLDDVNAFNSTVSKLHARFAAAVPPGVAPNHESSEPLVDPLCGWFVADVVACGWGGCAPIEGGEDSLWAAVRRALPANRRAAIVAVKGRFVAQFFEQHWASIQRAGLPVVLVSSHGDVAHPAPALWPLLDDPLLLAWYAQNLWAVHPKARPLPIGFEPRWRTQGTPQRLAAGRSWAASHAPQKLLLVNFGLQTHPYRRYVDELSRARGWSQWATVTKVGAEIKPSVKGTGYASHDLAIADHKFVLAVRGNGIDTFRLWLTLYLGRIPIVVSSAMDPAFEGLPVLILPADRPPPDLRYSTSVSALDSAENAVTLADGHRAWALLQREWLEEQWEKMTSVAAMSLYDSRRLYAGAWACAIRAAAAAPGATLPACDVTAPLQDDATRAAFASFNNLTDLASEGPWRRLESGRKKVDYYNGSCRAECYHPRRWGNARNTNATFHY